MIGISSIDLQDKHFSLISDILNQHLLPTDTVFVYGSRVKFTAKKYSDLDLAIITNKPLSTLINSFEESNLPFTVDVLDYYAIPESFRDEIAKCSVVFPLYEYSE